MVRINKQNEYFVFEVKGLHKFLTFKNKITVAKKNIVSVYRNWEDFDLIVDLKMPGIHVPGLITAGTFISKTGKIFYDVTDNKKSIVVELKNEKYEKLIIDVEDVERAIL